MCVCVCVCVCVHVFKEGNWHIYSFEKKINVGFFSDTLKVRSFKFCMIITLIGVFIVILGLMILTLNQALLHKFKEIMHNVICVTDVYSREIINMFFVDLGLSKTETLEFTLTP